MLDGIKVDYEPLNRGQWDTLQAQLYQTARVAAGLEQEEPAERKRQKIQSLFDQFNQLQEQAKQAERARERDYTDSSSSDSGMLAQDSRPPLDSTDSTSKEQTLMGNLSHYLDHLHKKHQKSVLQSAEEDMAHSLANASPQLASMLQDDHDDPFTEVEPATPFTSFQKVAILSGFNKTHLTTGQWQALDQQANAAARDLTGDNKPTKLIQLLFSFREFSADSEVATTQQSGLGLALERDSAARALRGDMLDRTHSHPRQFTSGYSSDDDDEMGSTRRGLRRQSRKRRPSPLAQATRPTLTESSAAPPPQKRRRLNAVDLTKTGQSPRTASATVADWSTPSLLPGNPASPQPQTTAAAQQPAPTPAQDGEQGEPSPGPRGPSSAAPAPQQNTGAQLQAPLVHLDGGFLDQVNQRFQGLTGKSTITCEFADNQSKLIAKEPDGKEIARVDVTPSADGLSIQHHGTEPSRQLAASAAVAALTATPGAKIKVESTGGKLSDKEIKAEYKTLLNAGATHDQLDLSDLPSKLQTEIQQLQPQQPQQPQQQRETQFAVKPPKPPKDPLRPFEAQAAKAAAQGAEAAGLVTGTDADFDHGGALQHPI
ncbi:hypothetical protein [Piscirickettsia salmonis]|nr:hypothetical protein [Piscirickettsia salmonis]